MTPSVHPRRGPERRAQRRHWLPEPWEARVRLGAAAPATRASVINLSASGICLRIAGMVPDGAAVALELGPDRIALTLAWSLAGAKPEHGTLAGFACTDGGTDLLARFSALGHVVDGPGRTGAEPPGG